MKTFAHFKGHPIHAMLIPFPIAFLIGAAVCDAVGWLTGLSEWGRAGAWLSVAGIVAALVAAVPGMLDYLYSVPPNSSGFKRATWHMTVNLTSVSLFAIGWMFRPDGAGTQPGLALVLVEVAGALLLTLGGWMGGTLVNRNFLGPEHRYANAAKWSEQRFKRTGNEPIEVCRSDDLKVDQMRLLHVGQERIVLARTEKGYVAFQDRCTHRGASLADGVLMCGQVQCLWHGSQFDVATGAVKAGPTKEAVKTYQLEEKNGAVFLTLK
jgi:nitrite reductase/ring-hydroxylating ferredoxin subunit/uncharacterized membrane protein